MWGAFGDGLTPPPEQITPWWSRQEGRSRAFAAYRPVAVPVNRCRAALQDLAAVVALRPRRAEVLRQRLVRLHSRRIAGRHGLLSGWLGLLAAWRAASRGVPLRRAAVAAAREFFDAWRVLARDRIIRLLNAELGW